MKKKLNCLRIVSIVIILVALITGTSLAADSHGSVASSDPAAPAATMTKETIEEKKVPKVLTHFQTLTYVETDDKNVINFEFEACKDYEFRLITLLNNPEMADERELVKKELADVRGLISNYENDLAVIEAEEARIAAEQAKIEAYWNAKSEKYPEATTVWRYMKEQLGWNDYVCAGVMGNMMAEVGGQTLNLQPYLYGHSSASYYGICQWSSRYYPYIQGASLEAQLDFLRDTVQKELNTYGYLYRSGMKYEEFCNLNDAEAAALAFAKAYERCGSGSYGIRQSNALKALEYFTK